MAKKTTPAPAKKKAQPVQPPAAGGRTPPPSGSGKAMPPWITQAAKKAAPKRTPRKAGGK
jgi:hypothetical protein